ncbi:MAG: threonylcarbamoyl-AMP synthase [Phycisphaerales bacterium]|nr:threonylcarbamoyl-AMP synthase [Phycisphaerales bacterium]
MTSSEAMLDIAAAHVRAGGLVAFPTETVYGLGADATSAEAVARVFAAKGRPSHNPLIVHVDGEAMAEGLVERWTSDARKLAAAFWPGPLSIVLPKRANVPEIVTGGGASVAVRCPDHPMTRRLIERAGVPLVGPSANKSGFVSPTSAEHVRREFEGAMVLGEGAGPGRPRPRSVDDILVLDGGVCSRGIESTVVKLPVAIGDGVRVLRQGVISAEEIAKVLGRSVEDAAVAARADEERTGGRDSPTGVTPLESPGLLDRHYAPRTPAFRFTASQWPEVLEALLDLEGEDGSEARGVVLTIGSRGVPVPHVRMIMPEDSRSYAARLYAAFREADELGAQAIYVESGRENGDPIWAAIADRVRRATAALE